MTARHLVAAALVSVGLVPSGCAPDNVPPPAPRVETHRVHIGLVGFYQVHATLFINGRQVHSGMLDADPSNELSRSIDAQLGGRTTFRLIVGDVDKSMTLDITPAIRSMIITPGAPWVQTFERDSLMLD